VETTILYRLAADGPWVEGKTINVSPTGVLFSTASAVLPPGAILELVLELSAIGLTVADVSCQARIVRTLAGGDSASVVAAAIERYRFTPKS
jgi:hypothetical protein